MGRPKAFEPAVALEHAMELFWRKGYEATSVQDLVEGMGINRQSIYDTFGDKHALFVEAVRHYHEKVVAQIPVLLGGPGSPIANIRRVLKFVSDFSVDGEGRGCLVTNTVVELAPHDSAVAEMVCAVLREVESAFYAALVRAAESGELPAGANPRALARFFTSTVQGIVVMGKASASRAAVRDIAKVALSVLE